MGLDRKWVSRNFRDRGVPQVCERPVFRTSRNCRRAHGLVWKPVMWVFGFHLLSFLGPAPHLTVSLCSALLFRRGWLMVAPVAKEAMGRQ